MRNRNSWLLALWLITAAVGPALAANGEELPSLSVNSPWNLVAPTRNQALLLVTETGAYRIENLSQNESPVEFSIASQGTNGIWKTVGTNTNLKGQLEASIEVTLEREKSYKLVVLPPASFDKPLRFRMVKVVFSGLREQLKQDLTYTLPDNLPLHERLTWSVPTAIGDIRASFTPSGEIFAASLSPDRNLLQVWSLTQKTKIGNPVNGVGNKVGTFDLTVTPEGLPLVAFTVSGSEALRVRFWNGVGWVDQTPANQDCRGPFCWTTTPKGPLLSFQAKTEMSELGLVMALWTSNGWQTLEGEPFDPNSSKGPVVTSRFETLFWQDRPVAGLLHPNRVEFFDRKVWNDSEAPEIVGSADLHLAASSDFLYAAWQKSDATWLVFQYRTSFGWQVLPSPRWSPSLAPAQIKVVAANGSLWLAEWGNRGLSLHQFDGLEWRSPLRLQALTDSAPLALQFLPPTVSNKAGSLMILSGKLENQKLAFYDLP